MFGFFKNKHPLRMKDGPIPLSLAFLLWDAPNGTALGHRDAVLGLKART